MLRGLNFTLTTKFGNLDLFGEVVGGGTYEDLLLYSEEIEVFGVKCFCLQLERLIHIKRSCLERIEDKPNFAGVDVGFRRIKP